jgi:hypothetical protein
VKTEAGENSESLPLEQIVKQLYDAASSERWRQSQRSISTTVPISLPASSHANEIRLSLDRARRKSFVRAIKPLRRLLRNQGAVNDSVIEALCHLYAQSEQMIEALSELQSRFLKLEGQVQELRGEQTRPGSISDRQITP